MMEVQTMPDGCNVMGICGSLRRGSYNRKLLQVARQLAPQGMTIDICDLYDIPDYNPDVEAQGIPEPVQAFTERIRAADALLIATPEYNYSIPGVLKNAIDWASRPAGKSPLRGKPMAVMGASTGNFGTVRAQMVLRQILLYTRSHVMLEPEVTVYGVASRFDDAGELTDEPTRQFLADLLNGLDDWVRTFQA